jgi:hypothetical protein
MDNLPHILLVDDEEDITANLSPFLERSGFQVSVAANGEEALLGLRWRPFGTRSETLVQPETARRPATRRASFPGCRSGVGMVSVSDKRRKGDA